MIHHCFNLLDIVIWPLTVIIVARITGDAARSVVLGLIAKGALKKND